MLFLVFQWFFVPSFLDHLFTIFFWVNYFFWEYILYSSILILVKQVYKLNGIKLKKIIKKRKKEIIKKTDKTHHPTYNHEQDHANDPQPTTPPTNHHKNNHHKTNPNHTH